MLQKYTKIDSFLQCFLSFVANISLGWLNVKKTVNLLIYNKTLYNNANITCLAKIFDTQDIFERVGSKSVGNLATQAIIQNIQEIPIIQTVQSALQFWPRNILIIANWDCIDGYYWFRHLCQLVSQWQTRNSNSPWSSLVIFMASVINKTFAVASSLISQIALIHTLIKI